MASLRECLPKTICKLHDSNCAIICCIDEHDEKINQVIKYNKGHDVVDGEMVDINSNSRKCFSCLCLNYFKKVKRNKNETNNKIITT
jgi:hypothetical protein